MVRTESLKRRDRFFYYKYIVRAEDGPENPEDE